LRNTIFKYAQKPKEKRGFSTTDSRPALTKLLITTDCLRKKKKKKEKKNETGISFNEQTNNVAVRDV
jgi:DUF1009 family protein